MAYVTSFLSLPTSHNAWQSSGVAMVTVPTESSNTDVPVSVASAPGDVPSWRQGPAGGLGHALMPLVI